MEKYVCERIPSANGASVYHFLIDGVEFCHTFDDDEAFKMMIAMRKLALAREREGL